MVIGPGDVNPARLECLLARRCFDREPAPFRERRPQPVRVARGCQMKRYEGVAGEIFRQLAQQVCNRLDRARRPSDDDQVTCDHDFSACGRYPAIHAAPRRFRSLAVSLALLPQVGWGRSLAATLPTNPLPSFHVSTAEARSEADDRFFLVGVGASAGGVEALEHLFASMPEQIEAALVVITHLSAH